MTEVTHAWPRLRPRFPAMPAGYPLYLGCTAARHRALGIHAVINARGGEQWRNDLDPLWKPARVERRLRRRGLTVECPWCGSPVPFAWGRERRFCELSCRRSFYS